LTTSAYRCVAPSFTPAMVAKLYFYYSAMNAGKSTLLIQASYNYNERGLNTLGFIPKIIGASAVKSRVGLSMPAIEFDSEFNFVDCIRANQEKANKESPQEGKDSACACVLIDEAQFLTKEQVRQLSRVVDELQVPVLCYGLRSDFKGEPFEGSKYLLTWADVLSEVKTICSCGRKANMNQRVTATGETVAEGAQIEVGGNERYMGKCRKHFWAGLNSAATKCVLDNKNVCDSCNGELPATPVRTPRGGSDSEASEDSTATPGGGSSTAQD